MSNHAREIIEIKDDNKSPTRIENIIEYLPPNVAEAVKNLPEELLNCKPDKLDPTEVDKLLRVSFWREFEDREKQNRPFMISNVIDGICSRPNFYSEVLKTQRRLAYMIRPFVKYDIHLNKLHELGLRRLEEILSKENADSKMAAVQVKALEFVNVRLHGSPVQNIKKLQMNVDVKSEEKLSPEQLEAKLQEIKEKSATRIMKNVGPAPEEN